MGDSLAWIPYVEEFRKKHGCEVWCAISPVMAELLAPAYPDLHFVAPRERPGGLYASYYVGCFFPSDNRTYQPMSWKRTGLQGAAAEILGLPRQEIRPRLPEEDAGRIIKEPYVCIAVQASSQPKYWNNPMGWMEVVAWLKERGYRVLCIDREKCYGDSWHKNLIPWGAEDFTGNHPLKERMEMLRHADFFIGLASGLSWLAWAAGIPVVMISGFSLPMTEFSTPYRIINYHVCNGCWEDDRFDFEHGRFDWCPRHQEDKEKQFECTRAIASPQVISAIQRLMEDHGLDPQTDQKES
jgi:autotransporter strand-loop-strand O-heptosyltransferase